jgi:ribonuclease HI
LAVQVVVHVDGGARGNPGPAAAAAVVSTPDGRVLDESAVTLGRATNNVAEYHGLLLGLERAAALGATEVDVVNDSELVARQVDGSYKVKNADLQPLHAQAKQLLGRLDRWSIRSVPRAENAAADALVNRALDGTAPAADDALVNRAPDAEAPANDALVNRAPDAEAPANDALVNRAPAAEAAAADLVRVARRASESWSKRLREELEAARRELAAGRRDDADARLRRAAGIERLLRDQAELLEALGVEHPPALPDDLSRALRELRPAD